MKLTPDNLLSAYRKLGSAQAVAKKFNVSVAFTYYHLRQHPDYVSTAKAKWTDAHLDSLLARYAAGESLKSLAAGEGCTLANLYYYLRRLPGWTAIERPKLVTDKTKEKRETAQRLRRAGFSLQEIGDRLGCSRQYASHLVDYVPSHQREDSAH